jgi:hypothetical protein
MLEGEQEKLFADLGIDETHAAGIARICGGDDTLNIAGGEFWIRKIEQGRKRFTRETD